MQIIPRGIIGNLLTLMMNVFDNMLFYSRNTGIFLLLFSVPPNAADNPSLRQLELDIEERNKHQAEKTKKAEEEKRLGNEAFKNGTKNEPSYTV